MKLVGEAMHKYGLDVPVVGVAPWGAISGRSLIENCKGEQIEYRDVDRLANAEPGAGAKLNPYHTHQILVDTATFYDNSTPVFGQEQVIEPLLEPLHLCHCTPPCLVLVSHFGRMQGCQGEVIPAATAS